MIADGWTITHDPFVLKWGTKDLFVDLGAERLLAADKAGQKIAVEVKSFSGASEINDLEKALGQFILYHDVLGESEPHRRLYLAIAKADDDVALDLQAVLNECCEEGLYVEDIDYSQQPDPPLEGDDISWEDALLREHGLR